MSDFSHDPRWLISRLSGTVIRVNNRAFYVDSGSSDGKDSTIGGFYLRNNQNLVVKLYCDEVNLHSPPLGFVNINRQCVFIARTPKRADWRQGIRLANVWVHGGKRIDVHDFFQPIDNVYPPRTLCASLVLNEEVSSVAFHRRWAFTSGLRVQHKNLIVGKLNIENEQINLDTKYSYLQEMVERDIYAND